MAYAEPTSKSLDFDNKKNAAADVVYEVDGDETARRQGIAQICGDDANISRAKDAQGACRLEVVGAQCLQTRRAASPFRPQAGRHNFQDSKTSA
mmetsp:Transcript_7293/g.19004  ORF Transcript_7293/g.19004 Transcript_7293/m.19004 type:complete len:94 (+) Transcript_7293:628-909(+)